MPAMLLSQTLTKPTGKKLQNPTKVSNKEAKKKQIPYLPVHNA